MQHLTNYLSIVNIWITDAVDELQAILGGTLHLAFAASSA